MPYNQGLYRIYYGDPFLDFPLQPARSALRDLDAGSRLSGTLMAFLCLQTEGFLPYYLTHRFLIGNTGIYSPYNMCPYSLLTPSKNNAASQAWAGQNCLGSRRMGGCQKRDTPKSSS